MPSSPDAPPLPAGLQRSVDTGVDGLLLAVDAARVDLEQDADAMAGPAGDLGCRDSTVEPERDTGVAQVVGTAGERRRDLCGLNAFSRASCQIRPYRDSGKYPPVRYVRVQVAPQPYYSGTFFNLLTGGSNSALAVAAWQWAEYQWMAEVAVSTGQAALGALLSGLEAQEVQNWREISNVAGYVNGIWLNLQEDRMRSTGAARTARSRPAERYGKQLTPDFVCQRTGVWPARRHAVGEAACVG